jgi:hypothetical protein
MKKEEKKRDSPTPIRLKDLKGPLQMEAMKLDRSLNWFIISILKEHPCLQEYLKNKPKECRQS